MPAATYRLRPSPQSSAGPAAPTNILGEDFLFGVYRFAVFRFYPLEYPYRGDVLYSLLMKAAFANAKFGRYLEIAGGTVLRLFDVDFCSSGRRHSSMAISHAV